ncbi:MAG: HEAT repeat domain-containing protein [Clostridiales bacterium]|nr:HEAT repeat domain-containing protein [Clostridiales bacterium]
MHDTLIDSVINKRIEEAETQGDISLLQQHLSPNYDEHVHRIVYQALGRIGGLRSLRILVAAASAETSDETKQVILEALADAVWVRSPLEGCTKNNPKTVLHFA